MPRRGSEWIHILVLSACAIWAPTRLAAITLDFEHFPGADGFLGTADDVPSCPPAGCDVLPISSEYVSVGIYFTSGVLLTADYFWPGHGNILSDTRVDAYFLKDVRRVSVRSYSYWTATLTAYDHDGNVIGQSVLVPPVPGVKPFEGTLSVTTVAAIARITVIPDRPEYILNLDDLQFCDPSHPPQPDLDGDGQADILWRNETGALQLWQMSGTSIVASERLGAVSNDWRIEGLADFDGDGHSDILWRQISSGATYLWLMNGATVRMAGYTALQADVSWTLSGIGDIDGDGRADILWRDPSGALFAWGMNGTAIVFTGGFGSVSPSWQIERVADFDGDGCADILWRQPSSGATYVWLLHGTAVTGGGFLDRQLGPSWTIAGVGDLDGDGRADIVWRDASGAIAIWQMNGILVASAASLPPVATNWRIQAVADYNGDGWADILWRDSGTGATYLWLMRGSTSVPAGYTSLSAGLHWRVVDAWRPHPTTGSGVRRRPRRSPRSDAPLPTSPRFDEARIGAASLRG